MIRLNDINNFIDISEFESLNMASKKMEISQPALSESLKRLELDLGVKLFYRTKNGISLTPEGKKALEESKLIRGLLLNLGTKKKEVETTITLGCHATIGSYFLPDFFSALSSKFPHYKINLKHGLSRNIQAEIQAGKIDIGIIVNPIKQPALIVKHLAWDKVCPWKSTKVEMQDQAIADENLFQAQSILKRWKKAPKNLISTDNLELITRLTEKGIGYGIIPERTVRLLKANLTPVTDAPSYKDEFSLVYRPEFGKTIYEKFIIELIGKLITSPKK